MLKNTEIRRLQSLFNINIFSVREVGKSVNDTYNLICDKGTFALRKTIETLYYGLKQAISEYFLLQKFNSKSSLQIIKPYMPPKKDGNNIYFMTHWVFGNKFDGSDHHRINAAKYLAKLHDELNKLDFTIEEGPADSYIDDLLSGKRSNHIDFNRYYKYTKKPSEKKILSFLEKLTQNMADGSKNYQKHLGIKEIVHGDPRAENLIFTQRKVLSIIDFQGVRKDYPISDVAWAISTGFCKNELDQIDLEKMKKFLVAYLSIRKLDGLKLLPSIIKIRHIRGLETIFYFKFIKKDYRPQLTKNKDYSINLLEWLDHNQQKIEDIIEKL